MTSCPAAPAPVAAPTGEFVHCRNVSAAPVSHSLRLTLSCGVEVHACHRWSTAPRGLDRHGYGREFLWPLSGARYQARRRSDMSQKRSVKKARRSGRYVIGVLVAAAALFTAQGTAWAAAPTFATHVDYTIGSGVLSVQVADFDKDGHLDQVTANSMMTPCQCYWATATAPSTPRSGSPSSPQAPRRQTWPLPRKSGRPHRASREDTYVPDL